MSIYTRNNIPCLFFVVVVTIACARGEWVHSSKKCQIDLVKGSVPFYTLERVCTKSADEQLSIIHSLYKHIYPKDKKITIRLSVKNDNVNDPLGIDLSRKFAKQTLGSKLWQAKRNSAKNSSETKATIVRALVPNILQPLIPKGYKLVKIEPEKILVADLNLAPHLKGVIDKDQRSIYNFYVRLVVEQE